MHFYDMLELSNEFIFQTAHHATVSYSQSPLDKNLLNHYQALGHTIVMPEINASLFYFIDFIPMSYPSYTSCSKLVDNQCSIYGRRPTSCRLAPFDSKFDDSQQWRTLQYFKTNTEEHDWKCNFNSDAPIVFKNEQIQQPSQNSLYFQSVDNIRDFTDKYIEFLGIANKEHQTEHFKAVFQSISKNSLMISDMIIPLQVARYHNIISGDFALEVIHNQLNLIENEMNQALLLKRKEDLQTSRLYKRQKEDYLRAIKQNIFDTKIDEFGIL
jgi:Fe-S-cluster containining protein